MRGNSYRIGALAALSLTVLLVAGLANAAPIAGAEQTDFSATNDGSIPVFLVVSPRGASTPVLLPTPACPLGLARSGMQLVTSVHGWESPATDFGTREVSLQAHVHGTVTDTAGNAYGLEGNFRASGTTTFPDFVVPFDGEGHITIAGPNGVVSGDAVFVDVLDGPPEWDFYFTDIQRCNLR